MKKILLLALLLLAAKTYAQTADEVIQKYADAMGGLDNFKKVKTALLTGTVSTQGNQFPITVQIVNGKAVRTDVEIMGQQIVNCVKDDKGWKINPLGGAPAATDVTGEELKGFKNETFLASQLMDYKARGYQANLVGQDDVDGAKAYKIEVTTDDNKKDTYFVDAQRYMLVKVVGTKQVMGQDMEMESIFSDVKEFGGLKFSMARAVKSQGQTLQEIHFDKVELDAPIDDKIFDKP